MTVRELIKELQKMPQDAKVFVYSAYGEADDYATKVKLCNKEDVHDKYFIDAFYCQGDSYTANYISETEKQAVVVGRLD